MSIDLTQQALNALADAGLGDSPAKAHEAYVIGYTQGHNDALALAIRIEQSINATPGRDVTHPECFGRFTVVALSYGGAIRKCMRRVAQMCAKHSACEQLDRQEARA